MSAPMFSAPMSAPATISAPSPPVGLGGPTRPPGIRRPDSCMIVAAAAARALMAGLCVRAAGVATTSTRRLRSTAWATRDVYARV
jgi:hypothetical protein